MDKVSSSRAGMGQMAMYLYQAHRENGVTEENAKLYVAQEIEKLYNEYTAQAGVTRPLPKRAQAQAQDLHRYINEADNGSIVFKMMRNKAAELLETIKKG